MPVSTFQVVATSSVSAGIPPRITIAGEDVPLPGGPLYPGLNVAVIDHATAQVLAARNFDTGTGGAVADEFAQWIEDLPPGRVVAIAVTGLRVTMTDRAKRACRMVGSGMADNFVAAEGSWALIGQRGLPPGTAAEGVSLNAAASVTAGILFKGPVPDDVRIEVTSRVGHAVLRIQEQQVPWKSGPDGIVGMNVVVLDEATCQILQEETFSTASDPAASDAFAALIEGLPTGRMVAIAGRDPVAQLTDRARKACGLIGSSQIGRLSRGGVWSIVGFKDAVPGSVAEALSANRGTRCTYWNSPEPPNAVAGFSLAVSSAGYEDGSGNRAGITMSGIDATALPGGLPSYGRGLNVVVFDETSGAPMQAATYDTYASQEASDAFAALIESLPVGRLVAVAVQDEATASLTERARLACETIGSGQVRNLPYRGSWALIGRKGSAPGSVPEDVRETWPVSVQTWFALDQVRQTRPFNQLVVHSAGYDVGNYASISATMNPLAVRFPGYSRGLNVAVVNESTGQVLQARTFDTYASSAAADEFAALVEGLPAGRVVAIAVQDEAAVSLTERARRACESLGSGMIRNLAVRGSWAFVGKKGASPAAVAESMSPHSPASCAYWLFPDDRYPGSGFSMSAVSTGGLLGIHDYAWLAVRDKTIDMPGGYQRGLNVAVLDEKTGAVLSAAAYDTSGQPEAADEFAGMIEDLPPGRVVLLTAYRDSFLALTERARRACESLGSTAVRRLSVAAAWTLAGIKGTPPGSALEQMDGKGATALSTWLPFPAPAKSPAAGEAGDAGEAAEPGAAQEAAVPVIVWILLGVVAYGVLSNLALNAMSSPAVVPPPPPLPPAGTLRYDQTTFLAAHNAFASRGEGWGYPDVQQNLSIADQLKYGVRGLALDVHVWAPQGQQRDLYLCHGNCDTWWHPFAMPRTLTAVLGEVVAFLNANPREIITIFIESPAGWLPDATSNQMFIDSFNKSGASPLIFWPDRVDPSNPPPGTPAADIWNVNPSPGVFHWPVLNDMISKNKRLVLFVDRNTDANNTLHHIVPFVWRYVRESVFSDRGWPWDNDCGERGESRRGRQANRSVFLWNHFASIQALTSVTAVNDYNRLLPRAQKCSRTFGQVPNFLEVDFVDTGGGRDLVTDINTRAWSQPDPLTALMGLKPRPVKDEL